MDRMFLKSVPIIITLLSVPCVAHAQFGSGKSTAPLPKSETAKSKTAPAPAPPHDLSGIWMMHNPPAQKNGFAMDYGFSGTTYTDPKTNPPALTPWGEEKFKEAKDSNAGTFQLDQTNDPVLTRCYPPGTPRVYFHPYPFEFFQNSKLMLQVFEYDHTVRRIYMDGRALPTDPDPSWMGYSVGHWDGDSTLVVDTVGFNDKTWLDRLGHAHSEQLHVTERFRRVDVDHLELDITMTDPKALAKPWATTFYYQNRPDWELGEISCSGDYLDWNEFEISNMKKKEQKKDDK